ncbi:MAG: bifunctional riboflavin kinase/FAD synthetase [Sedimentisphaerales bacterium]|jgi:riboflavin kinase/FMN adenylyltransferase|nr:bifunctional riboflavin kinase/FAD synthetase [Sedimentisphaerales bacterium]
MKILRAISDFEKIKKGCVLTIGNFDGVHLGHQEILAAAKRIAQERAAELVAMTFEPHPVAILHPDRAPGMLTPLELKTHLLAECGVDALIVLEDNRWLLNLSPGNFASRFIVDNMQPGVVVEGDDFNFGLHRAGNIDTLRELGSQRGFEVCVIGPKEIKLSTGQTVRVSSTLIRYMLESGHVADAAAALGRPYRLIEKIIPGRGIGKKLGFPTLNMKKPTQVIPAEGVYAGFVKIGQTIENVLASEEKIPAVYSIGQARTYGEEFPLLIEAHLLIENVGDLIGKYMAMDFVERIRSQHKFKTSEELSAQIAKDCQKAKELLPRPKI